MFKLLVAISALLAISSAGSVAFGRGFGGGMRGGGFGGGGFRGAGSSFGGMRGGFQGAGHADFGGTSGFRGDSFSGARADGVGGYRGGAGGFRNDGFDGAGGLRGDSFAGYRGGATPSRGDLNRFLGLPSDAGLHSVSSSHEYGNYTVNRGAVEGPRGGVAGGAAVTGPAGNTAARGAAVGPRGGAVAGRGVAGAGGASVAQGVARGPGGAVAGGTVARGSQGGVAARGYAAGFGYHTPSDRYLQGGTVRAGFSHWGLYTPGWYAGHPGAWAAAGLTAAAWQAATWGGLNNWFGYSAVPAYYDYGNNIAYQDGSVYYNGDDVGTADQYYQQAASLATTGAQAQAGDPNWMPLGVFAMTHDNQTESNFIIQLAVNKQGVVRGNYTDTANDKTLSIQGAVDRKTQRVAWTIGDNKSNVLETGLYNLTKDEAPLLVHFGKDRTEQWLLVRLNPPDQGEAIN